MEWLLAGDASIRWQVMRDIVGVRERVWLRERARIGNEGWGARLLSLQDPDGRWARGLYTPKWTSTVYTLLLLRTFGLAADQSRACRVLLDAGFWVDGGINYYPKKYKRSETCISSMVLAICCYFGLDDPRLDRLAEHIVEQQMTDGGWNCCAMPGYGNATHGSFHTTISALEALMEYSRHRPWRAAAARLAQRSGREFLLVHKMFRSHRTGKVAKPAFLRFVFPARWHYDILRGLDYFRESGAERDARLSDAIAVIHKRRQPDGRWLLPKGYPGKVFFELEPAGKPSRWNTLRAMRVLRWWELGNSI